MLNNKMNNTYMTNITHETLGTYKKYRSTSAGYRLPLSSRPKSAFHERCVPAETHRATGTNTGAAPTKSHSEADLNKLDAVTQDKIWKQRVNTESQGVKAWETSWGFLTEFDPKGEPKAPKEIPEEATVFSDIVPNTNSGNYGSRLTTEIGQTMQNLEFQFNSGRRKKKLSNDLICY